MTSRESSSLPDQESLLASVRERIAADATLRGRLRALPTHTRVLLAGALALALAAATALLLLRSDLDAYPPARMAATLVILLALTIALAALLLGRIHTTAKPGRLRLLLALGLAVPVVAALLPEAHHALHAHPESFVAASDFWRRAAACLLVGTLLGLPFLLMLVLLDRSDRWSARTLVPATAAAGLVGNVALQIHCPIVEEGHLLAGHAPVALALVLLGLLAVVARRRSAKKNGRAA